MLIWALTAAARAQGLPATEASQVALEQLRVEVGQGEEVLVPVGPFEEAIPLDPRLFEVRTQDATTLAVHGLQPGMGSVLLIRAGRMDALTVIVRFRGPEASRESERLDHVPFFTYLADGRYVHSGGDAGSTGQTLQEIELAQDAETAEWLMGTEVASDFGGKTYLRAVDGLVEAGRTSAQLGDLSQVVATGVLGIPLRGASVLSRLGDSDFRVGGIAGLASVRQKSCCSYFDPDGSILGAVNGRYDGKLLDAQLDLGGQTPLSGGAPGPLFRTRADLVVPSLQATAEVGASGLALGSYALVQWDHRQRIGASAQASGATAGMMVPGMDPIDHSFADGWSALWVRPWTPLRVTAEGLAGFRGATDRAVASRNTGLGGSLSVVSGRNQMTTGYRLVRTEAEESLLTHDLRGSLAGSVARDQLSARASTSVRLASDGALDLFYTTADLAYTPGPHLRTGPTGRFLQREDATFASAAIATELQYEHWGGRAEAGGWYQDEEGLTERGPRFDGDLWWGPTPRLRIGVLGGAAAVPVRLGPQANADPYTWYLGGRVFVSAPLAARGGRVLGLAGRVSGVVFLDEDGDGVRDEGEGGLGHLVLRLDDKVQVTTDDSGAFEIGGVAVGSHRLHLDRGEWHSVDGTVREIDIHVWTDSPVSFALSPGTRIDGRVFLDRNHDGEFGPQDTPVGLGRVSLVDAKGEVLGVDDANQGIFGFTGLQRGEYEIQVDPMGLPVGYYPTRPLEVPVVLASDVPVRVNVPLEAIRSVGGRVWLDTNLNRAFDAGRDRGLGDVEVLLHNGVDVRVRTDAEGNYLFRDVPEGAFELSTPGLDKPRRISLPEGPMELLREDLVLRGEYVPVPVVAAAAKRDVAGPNRPERTVEPTEPSTFVALRSDPTVFALAQGEQAPIRIFGVGPDGTEALVTDRVRMVVGDPTVVRVRQGEVIAVGPGTTSIFAVLDVLRTPTMPVEVTSVPLVGLTLKPSEALLSVGGTLRMSAVATFVNGKRAEAGEQVRWLVRDEAVAQVDSGGVLTAMAEGVTEVSAEWQGVRAFRTLLTVTREVPEELRVEPDRLALELGEEQTLPVVAKFGAREQDAAGSARWVVADTRVVEVGADGLLRAVGTGTTTVVAEWMGVRSNAVLVEVAGAVNAVGLAVEPYIGKLPRGMRVPLTAIAVMDDGSFREVTDEVEWRVLERSIAIVATGGVLTSIRGGRTEVVASWRGQVAPPVLVEVVDEPLVGLEVTPQPIRIAAGGVVPVSATALYGGGGTSDASALAQWVVEDPRVAQVSAAGTIAGVARGRTTVVATWGGARSKPVAVLVAPADLVGVTVDAPERVRLGETVVAHATALMADGNLVDVTAEVVWTSTRSEVIAVEGPSLTARGVGRVELVADWLGIESRPIEVEVVAE